MMKKLIAAILAITMTCAFVTGCGDSSSVKDSSKTDSSSSLIDDSSESDADKKETTTTTTTQPEETTTQATSQENPPQSSSSTEPSEEFKKSYTYKFQQTLLNKKYSITMTMTMDYTGSSIPVTFESNGDDFHMVMDMSALGGEADTETYFVGGKTYAVIPSAKTYSVTDGESGTTMQVSPSVSPNGNIEFISSSEENGMIVEKMNIKTTNASGAAVTNQATYFYDKASGAPKKVEVVSSGKTSTVEVTSYNPTAPEIKLPDFTGWTKIDTSQLMPGNGQQY